MSAVWLQSSTADQSCTHSTGSAKGLAAVLATFMVEPRCHHFVQMFQPTCVQNSTFSMVLNTFADVAFSQQSCKVALQMCCRHQIYHCGHLLCKVSRCFQASDRFHSAKPLIRGHVSSHSSPGKLPPALMAARYVSISVIDLATAWPSMMQPGPGS